MRWFQLFIASLASWGTMHRLSPLVASCPLLMLSSVPARRHHRRKPTADFLGNQMKAVTLTAPRR